MPGIWPTRVKQLRKIPTGRRGIAIAVHVLAEQLDFGVARVRQRPASRSTLSLVRLRSGPRVNGTTQ